MEYQTDARLPHADYIKNMIIGAADGRLVMPPLTARLAYDPAGVMGVPYTALEQMTHDELPNSSRWKARLPRNEDAQSRAAALEGDAALSRNAAIDSDPSEASDAVPVVEDAPHGGHWTCGSAA